MALKMINKVVLTVMISTCMAGCYYDVEEELYPSNGCVVPTTVSYKTDVSPIITNNCLSCHSTQSKQGGIDLEGHTQLKKYASNGGLLGTIKHTSGFSKMPQGASKLSDCNIAKIEKWVNAGSLNN
jgi:cytochrome c553